MEAISKILKSEHNREFLTYNTEHLLLWDSWYRGKVSGFHDYRFYNGDRYVEMERKSLNMAKTVCEDWASLLFNEKTEIVAPNNQEFINRIVKEQNLHIKINEGIEKSFALGMGALLLNVNDAIIGDNGTVIPHDDAYVSIEFASAFHIKPIKLENRNIVEAAFVSEIGNEIHYAIHLRDEDRTYTIHNYVFDKNEKMIRNWKFNTRSKIAWFQILRPFVANNLYDYAYGISVFANAIDNLKAIDTKYDLFDWEYTGSRKRLFVSTELMTPVKTYDPVTKEVVRSSVFNPNDVYFTVVGDRNDNSGKPVLEDVSGAIRSDDYIKGINTELALLNIKVGKSENDFKFEGGTLVTATQIISDNSKTYRTKKKHEILLEPAIINTVYNIIYAYKNFTLIPVNDENYDDIQLILDDSIIEDTETLMKRDKEDVAAGLMTKAEYRMKWYGESEEDANLFVVKNFRDDLITRYQPAVISGLITPKEFVNTCYWDKSENERTELIEYITEQINKGTYDPYEYTEDRNN